MFRARSCGDRRNVRLASATKRPVARLQGWSIMASLFGKAPARPLSDIHIHHPDHAPIVNPAIPMS